MIVWLLVFLLVQFCAGVEDAWIVNITSHIFGFDWQPEDNLGDKNSKKFLEHQSNVYGAGVSRFFADKNLSLKRCILQTLSKGIADQDENTANFSSSLEFDGQRVLPPDDLRYMIMASVHGKAFQNNTVVMVSSSSVVDTSLTSKAAVTIQSEAANPCFPNKTNIYLPDPVAAFIICNKGKGHHVKCDPPKIFLAKTQRCVKTL